MSADILDIRSALMRVVNDAFKEEIEKISFNEQTTNAEYILNLCKIFTDKIEIKRSFTSYNALLGKRQRFFSSPNATEDYMVYGTQLIYSLRSFITNEDIIFHFGTQDNKGRLVHAYVPQEQVLKSLSQISKKGIGLTTKLERELIQINRKEKVYSYFEKKWNRIEYLARAQYTTGKNIDKIDTRKENAKRAHWAYQSQKKDSMVYIRFNGKGGYTRYYNLNGGHTSADLIYFNNGWLWEWYDEIYHNSSEDYLNRVHNSLNQGSLKLVFTNKEKDSISGTKQGDWRTLKGQEIQNKYNNSKIISYNNILQIMYELTHTLELFISSAKNHDKNTNNFLNILQKHFLPESSELGQNMANEIFKNEILMKFNPKENIEIKI